MTNYVEASVNLHVFFLRIMKEHAIFLEASFPRPNASFQREADFFKVQFERLLAECIRLGGRFICSPVLESGELVTGYTRLAEGQTQQLTGISINSRITHMEQQLCQWAKKEDTGNGCHPVEQRKLRQLNLRVLRLLNQFIRFKERILEEVTSCRMYTSNYPLLLEHILREARLYQSFLVELEETGEICPMKQKEMEMFWNQIMMEHALFIRGLLDPTESELIDTADYFVGEYANLLEEARNRQDCVVRSGTQSSREVTCRYREFKAAGTKGITGCEISSVILPLLADHVLREANHYLRLLDSQE